MSDACERGDPHLQAFAHEVVRVLGKLDVGRKGRSHPFRSELRKLQPVSTVQVRVPISCSKAHLEHGAHEAFALPGPRAGKHLDADASETPDVGLGRVSLLVVVDYCRMPRSAEVAVEP